MFSPRCVSAAQPRPPGLMRKGRGEEQPLLSPPPTQTQLCSPLAARGRAEQLNCVSAWGSLSVHFPPLHKAKPQQLLTGARSHVSKTGNGGVYCLGHPLCSCASYFSIRNARAAKLGSGNRGGHSGREPDKTSLDCECGFPFLCDKKSCSLQGMSGEWGCVQMGLPPCRASALCCINFYSLICLPVQPFETSHFVSAA